MLGKFFENALRKDHLIAVLALAVVNVAAWAYTVFGVGMNMTAIDMTAMPSDMPMPLDAWGLRKSVLMFAMWWVMMIAMMLPSAAPMVLLYQRVVERGRMTRTGTHTALFAFGYLLVWGLFSLAATVLHAVGEVGGGVNGMMASSSRELDAALLVVAGVWQLTPLKNRCLEACRAPVEFLGRIWTPGAAGALGMGIRHGTFCVGCCWAMMLLLFVGGVMNLYWIGGLALLALAERAVPMWHRVERPIGVIAIVVGVFLLTSPV